MYFNLKKKIKQNYGNKNCNLTIYNYVFQIPSQAKISNSREKKGREKRRRIKEWAGDVNYKGFIHVLCFIYSMIQVIKQRILYQPVMGKIS